MCKHIRKVIISLLLIGFTLLLSSCDMSNSGNKVETSKNNTISPIAKNNSTTTKNINNENKSVTNNKQNKDFQNNDNKAIRDFIVKFITATTKVDSKSFKELLDKDGIYSITYFEDGRDRNVVLHLYKDEIRDDLVLANSEKVGVTLQALFGEDIVDSKEDLLIHSSQFLNETSFGIDWHIKNETNVQNKLEDIVKTCEKLILTNNEYIPQVFRLKDNIFVFTQSKVAKEPYPEFIGDWLIFEKINNEYKVRVIMDFE